MDLVKELHDVETAYDKFSNQIEYLNNLIDATHYSIQKQKAIKGTGNDQAEDNNVTEKMENTDLKILLNETSHMNAIISAG